MFGFVLDIYLGFLIRWIVILWRNAVSLKWPTVSGRIVRCHFERHGYGGNYVVLQYKYKRDGERFQGVMKKPYMYPNYADAFVRHHPADGELKVRVNPKDPAMSFPILD
jgi:hypothetical protein